MIMYTILTTQNINNMPYILLLTIDFIVAIKGAINWTRLEKIQKEQLKQKNINEQSEVAQQKDK